jgi:CRP/FNR family transcriptional regulator, anaerobic regulatory protein
MMNISSGKEILNKCSTCVLGQFCLPLGLSAMEVAQVDTLVKDRVQLHKGDTLYRHGEPLNAMYSVRFGTLKTEHSLPDGRAQIIGFHMPGEILGLDGIGEHQYQANAIALEESEVCIIRFSEFENLASQIPSLQHQFHRILSRELTQDQRHLLSLGTLRAEERLAGFLINLSQRYAARGYECTTFDLKMSREDIGSYLGIQIETVSRMLSRFTESGLLQIKQRHVKLIDIEGLYQLAGVPNTNEKTNCSSPMRLS